MLDMNIIAMTVLHLGRQRRSAEWNEDDAMWFVELPDRMRRSVQNAQAWLRGLQPESDLSSGWTPREVWRSRPPHKA